jgi:hypothetical protein
METLNNIEKITLITSICVLLIIHLSILIGKINIQTSLKVFTKMNAVTILLLSSFLMKSQDTIYFKNNSILSVKINEVGISEIKYQTFNNLTGPNYLIQKNEIYKIKYSNGIIDTIVTANVDIKHEQSSTINMQLIGNKIYCDGKPIGKLKTHKLLMSNSLSNNQINLIKDVEKLQIYERNKKAFAPGLFILGVVVPAITSVSALGMAFSEGSNGNDAVALFTGGIVAGAALRISGHIVFKMNKNKVKAKKLELLEKYNQNELIY